MQLEFARPWALLLLPVVWGVMIWFSRGIRSRSRTRKWGEVLLRGLVLMLTVSALAGVSIRKSSDTTTTVFLVDLSDSMKSAQSQEAEFVQKAIADMPGKNQAGIVAFGSDAQIEQFVTSKKAFTDFQSRVTATATNLEQAVQTAMALFPEGSARRLVLLTDGAENEGTVSNLVHSVTDSDLELKVVRYDQAVEKEVYVSNVTLPDTIRKGDRFQVKVDVYATEASQATVSLYSGRTLKGQKEVQLQKGNNQLIFSDQGLEGGLKSYRVTVDSDQDTVTVNNTYSAFTTVEAPAKILLVEGSRGESKAFQKVLDACNFDYELVTPSGVPGQISDMTAYQSIILLDVYESDLRKGFVDNLETYVKDYAGGLIAIGGPNSFALGNYRNTPLETVLPVNMDLEGEKQVPKIAMTMVIDHSGSMSSPASGVRGATCMDVAKQAAINALDSLRSIDEVGVLAFDDGYTWSVPLQEAADLDAIAERIAGIAVNGGTSIYPALDEAMKAMKKSNAPIKHIVLLTDGQDGFHEYGPLLKKMDEYGITLSTVAVGSDSDQSTLSELAKKGGGRYYYSDADTTLPRIFAQEVYLSAKSYLINEEFTPTITNSHEIIKGIFDEGSPSLLGYIASTPKSTATVLLQSDREDPILSIWQYGLGRSVAWNSDASGNWSKNFSGWDSYASLWRNIIDWTISQSDLGEDTLNIEQEASSAILTYETQDYDGKTRITAVITDETGKKQEVELKASSPGVYKAQVDLDSIGVYSINVRNQEGEKMVKNINTATAMQYSREYRYADVTSTLESFVKRVSGQYIEKPEEVFNSQLKGSVRRTDITGWLLVAALLLFMADVILRRMHLDWLGALSTELGKGTKALRKARSLRKNTAGSKGGKKGKEDKGRKTFSGREDGIAEGKALPNSEEGEPSGSSAGNSAQGESGKPVSADQAAAGEGEGTKSSKPFTKTSAKGKTARKQDTKPGKDRKKAKPEEGVIDTAALLKKKRDRNL